MNMKLIQMIDNLAKGACINIATYNQCQFKIIDSCKIIKNF